MITLYARIMGNIIYGKAWGSMAVRTRMSAAMCSERTKAKSKSLILALWMIWSSSAGVINDYRSNYS